MSSNPHHNTNTFHGVAALYMGTRRNNIIPIRIKKIPIIDGRYLDLARDIYFLRSITVYNAD